VEQFPPGRIPAFLSEWARPVRPAPVRVTHPSPPRRTLLQRLQEAPASDRPEVVVGYLQERLIKVLGLTHSQRPEPQQLLNELGLDSLMGMELRNWIVADLGVNVPLERFIEGSSIAQMAELLLGQSALASVTLSETASDLDDDMEEITL
jgi:hypothetical protein